MGASLYFRRQFVLAATELDVDDSWRCIPFGPLLLYAHPDLEVTDACGNGRALVLLGTAYDPEAPSAGNAELIARAFGESELLDDVLHAFQSLVGCYAVLYYDSVRMFAFTDARGMKEIYYCSADNRARIASQPHLLARFALPSVPVSTRADLCEFTQKFLWDSRWIGDETAFDGVKHLLPNHCLDIGEARTWRYWPSKPVVPQSIGSAAAKISRLLRGAVEAMVSRHPVMMAVTAGTDSRTLLAASRNVQDKVYYFVNDENLSTTHPDIVIPTQMFAALGMAFRVHAVEQSIDADFRRAYYESTFLATERLLAPIYNVYHTQHSLKRYMQGIGEVGRTFYGRPPRRLEPFQVASKLGYERSDYALRQGAKICRDLVPAAAKGQVNVMALLYWEQRLGNWAATRNSESLIAIEKVDPFNSHRLYELLLGVPDKHKDYEKDICPLFRLMVQEMWPELLRWPINPPFTVRGRVVSFLTRTGAYGVLRELKYRAKYARHVLSQVTGERSHDH